MSWCCCGDGPLPSCVANGGMQYNVAILLNDSWHGLLLLMACHWMHNSCVSVTLRLHRSLRKLFLLQQLLLLMSL